MKSLRLAFGQILESKGMSLLMMAELSVTLIAINIFASQLSNLFALTNMYKLINAEQVWATDQISLENQSTNLPDQVIPIANCGEVTILPAGDSYKMDNNNPCVYLWPQEYYQRLFLKLGKGNWMTEPKQGYLNIIVPRGLSRQYAVGKTYSVTVWYSTGEEFGQSQQVDLYVCGVLADSMVITPGGGVNYDNKGILGLDLTDVLSIPNKNPNYFIFEAAPLSEEEKAVLDESGWSLLTSMKRNREAMISSLRLPIILSIALLCFCLSAFLGFNLLNLLDKEKRTAIYFMCGAKTGDIIHIKLLHDLILIGIPMLVSFGGLGLLSYADFIPTVSVWGVAVSYLFVAIIFGLSSFLFIRQLNQRSIISYIHKWL